LRFIRRKVKSNHSCFTVGDLCATKVRGDYIHKRNKSIKYLRKTNPRLKKSLNLKQQVSKSKKKQKTTKIIKKKK
jgi:hypothetical protein